MAALDSPSTVSVPSQCPPLHVRCGRRVTATMYTIFLDVFFLWITIASSEQQQSPALHSSAPAPPCGAAHTGVVTDDGEVYVWGCGDGGRLGLGASQMSSVLRPRRVRNEAFGASFSLYPQMIDCAGFFPLDTHSLGHTAARSSPKKKEALSFCIFFFFSFFRSFFLSSHRFVPLRPHARNRSPLPPHGTCSR